MRAESFRPDRLSRAEASSCSSTVVLILTRAMPSLQHRRGTRDASDADGAAVTMTTSFAQCHPSRSWISAKRFRAAEAETIDGRYVVTLPVTGEAQFFRLRKP